MHAMEWDASLATGHQTVDGQHRSIIGLINEFVALREADCDAGIVAAALLRLSDYVSTHFAEEERLMALYAYPERLAAEHRDAHLELSMRTRELVLAHSRGDDRVVCELITLMRGWLTEHIMRVDRGLVDHIRSERDARPV